MKTILFYQREVFEPGIYSKVFTIDESVPTPAGANTLVIMGEAPNGIEFGKAVQASQSMADNKALFGDKNPIIQAIFSAQNPSGEVEAAQHILVYNVRALVQASGMIQSPGPVDAINCKSRIYGVNGNSVKITQETVSTVVTVTVESSWMSPQSKVIDNPVFDITCVTALSTITITATSVAVFDGTTSHTFNYSEYPTLGLMLQAIRDAVPVAVVTKDVTTSDNTSTLNLFDPVATADITTLVTVKGDLKELYDFLDLEVSDIEVTREATAAGMPADFELQFTSGAVGSDPTATEWTNLLAEIEDEQIGALSPILDGLSAPYDSTLTKAVNALIATHAVNQAAAEKRGKKLQVYLPHYGGAGYSGVTVAGPSDVDTTVTDSLAYNSEYSQFIGYGLDDRDLAGYEHSFIPSYYAVKLASMAMGGPASRVLTGIGINCVKATNDFKESDRLKLHRKSIIFPVTDEKGTYTHMSYTTWKSDNDPMLTIPSRVRCAMLSDNDLARKFEAKKLEWAKSGVSPYISMIKMYAKRVLDSHMQSSINWITEYGTVNVTITGTQFNYEVDGIKVPAIPEYGFGKTTFLST